MLTGVPALSFYGVCGIQNPFLETRTPSNYKSLCILAFTYMIISMDIRVSSINVVIMQISIYVYDNINRYIRVSSINIDILVKSICVQDAINSYTRMEHKYSHYAD